VTHADLYARTRVAEPVTLGQACYRVYRSYCEAHGIPTDGLPPLAGPLAAPVRRRILEDELSAEYARALVNPE
jgi:hypothetical protein